MLKGNFTLKEEYKFKENPYFNKIIHNRHERFMKYIAYEVIPFIKSNYKLENNSEKWTIGGFSNGGAFVYSFACSYPGLFGNSIVMSPAGYNDYDILKSKCKYFICVGKYEHYSFMDNSLEYLTLMEENQIDYIHKTYDASHDWEMWLGFYIESIRIIY